jgi:Raf kinase inhibitor-like YbhB/YbcL family protein
MADVAEMTLRSDAFEEGGSIPGRFTCDGDDVSPPLSWDDPPAGAAGFVLVVDDPDASNFVHWILANIPADVRSLAEGRGDEIGVAGRNNFGRVGWGGPCPPSGEHRYRFRLYAIPELLDVVRGASQPTVITAMHGQVLGQGQLTASYRRAP